ncbi:hypothetical protein ACWDRB_46580 [Nonomuraea sp. NPDC003707]
MAERHARRDAYERANQTRAIPEPASPARSRGQRLRIGRQWAQCCQYSVRARPTGRRPGPELRSAP